jgi:hypothetical protein
VLYSQDIYTQSVQKKAEYSEDGIQLKHDEDDGAKENSLSLSPFISKIVETQLMSRTPVFFGDACIKRTSRYSTFPSQVNQSQFRLAIKSIFHLIRKKQEKTRRETSVDGI